MSLFLLIIFNSAQIYQLYFIYNLGINKSNNIKFKSHELMLSIKKMYYINNFLLKYNVIYLKNFKHHWYTV